MLSIFALLLSIVVPFGVLYIVARHDGREQKKAKMKKTLVFNLVSFAAVLVFSTFAVFSNVSFAEVAEGSGGVSTGYGLGLLAAAASTAIGALGAGIATGNAASAAIGAISENEGVFGRAILFVALAEGIAIYGLLISFMILGKL